MAPTTTRGIPAAGAVPDTVERIAWFQNGQTLSPAFFVVLCNLLKR